MRYVRNEKTCSCGKAVPGDANYCPACGRPQDLDTTQEVINIDATGVADNREA
jgi:RNA polymerase subunit RPABC4/transcription elongation factor Spt4